MPLNILSIQSWVAYGHVGHAAAVFPLQRLGHEVWAIHTVSYSSHLGYPTWRGRTHDPDELRAVLEGLSLTGVLGRCDAVLSGFLGDAGNAAVVAEGVASVRAANSQALYCCDPVIGDRASGVYVRPGVAEAIVERLLPRADLVVPNAFELQHLTGIDTMSLAGTRAALAAIAPRLPACKLCVVTGIELDGGNLGVLAVEPDAAWLAQTPRLDAPAHGAGDLFTALFLGSYLKDRSIPDALARAVSATFVIVEATVAAGERELQIIPAQEAIVAPARFAPHRIG